MVDETGYTEAKADVFLMFRMECSWDIISFEKGLHSELETWIKLKKKNSRDTVLFYFILRKKIRLWHRFGTVMQNIWNLTSY